MKILIDIGHPGHVHLFKNLYHKLKSKGHVVYVLTQPIPVAKALLEAYKIEYIILGRKRNSLLGKAIEMVSRTLKIVRVIHKEKIDFAISSTPSLIQASFLMRIPSIFMDDDDDAIERLVVKYAHPFSSVVLSPNIIKRNTSKSILYKGYHELAYLHPNCFRPNPSIIEKIGLNKVDRYFVLRFVALKGHHDFGHKGISFAQKHLLIEYLKDKGKVFITSESPIEPEFEEYRLPVSPEDIHSLIYYATMFIGDSQTMTSEAAILGVPALKCNTFAGKLSVPNELEEKYGLCYSYQPEKFDDYFNHIKQLLNMTNLKSEWKRKRKIFLKNKIDVSSFLVWFIENYPKSKQVMIENPDFQNKFK